MDNRPDKSRRDLLKTAGSLAVGVVSGGLPAGKADARTRARVPRWAMVIDLRRCIGCFSCQVTCKMEQDVPLEGYNARVDVFDLGDFPTARRVFLPVLCNHCEGNKKDKVPPCVKVCPEWPGERKIFITPEGKKVRYRHGATYKRPDGAILFDNDLCIGCGKCINECPYGARYFDPRVKAGKKPKENGIGKCTFCVERLEAGLEPACVQSCVGRARIFGDLNDPDSKVSGLLKAHKTKVLKPDEETRPNVYYIDLDDKVAALHDRMNQKTKVKG